MAVIGLAGCSPNKNKLTSNSTDKLETKVSQTKVSDEGKKKSPIKSSKAQKSDSYQSILERYTKILQDKSSGLVAEYNNEYPPLNGDINSLANLANKKVEKLAEISNEGTGEMAKLQLTGVSEYSGYEEWAGKLIDIYTQEAQKIMDAYLASAQTNDSMPQVQVPEFNQNEPEEQQIAQQQTTPSSSTTDDANAQYGTVQTGDGPQEIAGRYGLSVDEFLSLNGMDRNNFYFDPGQQVRIK